MAYATVEQLRTYLNIDSSIDDGLLSDLISRSQKAIENYTGRVFSASADSTRYISYQNVDGDTLWLDKDLCAITTVITNADDGSGGTTITSTYYTTYPRNDTPYYALRIKNNSTYLWEYTYDEDDGIKITGKWAYSTTPPDDVVHATIRLAAYYYRQKDAGVFDTTAIPDAGIIQVPQGMPRDVQIVLQPYRRLV